MAKDKNNLYMSSSEKIKRLVKYIIQCLVVVIAARYIPTYKIKTKDILMIGMVSSITFAILDLYAPIINLS